MITRLQIENFRSLKQASIQPGSLSFFCGPNGSGKTNLAEALDFLSATFQRGLSYAVAEKGGFFNMCYRKERRSRGAISFLISGVTQRLGNTLDMSCRFSLQTHGQTIRSDFFVQSEEYTFDLRTPKGHAFARFIRGQDSYNIYISPELPSDLDSFNPTLDIFFRMLKEQVLKPDPLGLLYPSSFESLFPFTAEVKTLTAIKVLRINPRAARQAGTPSVSGELGKFGENLPSAIDHLRVHYPKKFKEFVSLMREVYPGMAALRIDYTDSRQMGVFLDEEGFGSPWGAEDLSDGTLMAMALFLGILDPRYTAVVIEEPENSLHPWILRKFLQQCRTIAESGAKQILVTTQSPIVVASAKPEELFLIERKASRTEIVEALARDGVLPQMLKNQFLDLGEYWLSGGLGAVPEADLKTDELFPETDDDENSLHR